MKNPLCCGTRFLICSSLMLKLRAESLLLPPPKKKLPRARLPNRLLRNLRRRVQKGNRARSLQKATERNRAGYRPGARAFRGHSVSELGGRDSVDRRMFALGLNSLVAPQSVALPSPFQH